MSKYEKKNLFSQSLFPCVVKVLVVRAAGADISLGRDCDGDEGRAGEAHVVDGADVLVNDPVWDKKFLVHDEAADDESGVNDRKNDEKIVEGARLLRGQNDDGENVSQDPEPTHTELESFHEKMVINIGTGVVGGTGGAVRYAIIIHVHVHVHGQIGHC